MGYSMAARVARPEAQIVALLGDGAAGFSLMDADSLVRQGLPVVMVVGNNGMWGLEKHPMQAIYGWDVACDLQPGCRYDEVVRALGGGGELVTDPERDRPGARPGVRRRRPVRRQRRHRPRRRLPPLLQPRLTHPRLQRSCRCACRGGARSRHSAQVGVMVTGRSTSPMSRRTTSWPLCRVASTPPP